MASSMYETFNMNKPSQFEQDIAFAYSTRYDIYRPDITYWNAAVKWLSIELFIVIITAISTVSIRLFFDMVLLISNSILISEVVLNIFLLRWFLIDIIKLYQHYAPDDVRRRCHMLPSCSEYAIISLRRYGLIIGILLSTIRLRKRCDCTYRIEYPSLKHLKYGLF